MMPAMVRWDMFPLCTGSLSHIQSIDEQNPGKIRVLAKNPQVNIGNPVFPSRH